MAYPCSENNCIVCAEDLLNSLACRRIGRDGHRHHAIPDKLHFDFALGPF